MHPTCFLLDRWKPLCYCVRTGEFYPRISAIRFGNQQCSKISKFSEWHSKEITKALDKGQGIHEVKVDTTQTVTKPIHAQWIIGPNDRLRNDVELTKKSFKEAGITSAIEEEIELVDPFKDLD